MKPPAAGAGAKLGAASSPAGPGGGAWSARWAPAGPAAGAATGAFAGALAEAFGVGRAGARAWAARGAGAREGAAALAGAGDGAPAQTIRHEPQHYLRILLPGKAVGLYLDHLKHSTLNEGLTRLLCGGCSCSQRGISTLRGSASRLQGSRHCTGCTPFCAGSWRQILAAPKHW